jgi:hypothetical protein
VIPVDPENDGRRSTFSKPGRSPVDYGTAFAT